MLGRCYETGLGTSRDPRRALEWFEKAARQNHPAAQFNLALTYRDGRGTEADEKQTFYWYRKAADQHVAEAQMLLGVAYLQGLGTRKDPVRAHQWLSLSVEAGTEAARESLEQAEKQLSAEQLTRARELAAAWHREHPAKSD